MRGVGFHIMVSRRAEAFHGTPLCRSNPTMTFFYIFNIIYATSIVVPICPCLEVSSSMPEPQTPRITSQSGLFAVCHIRCLYDIMVSDSTLQKIYI